MSKEIVGLLMYQGKELGSGFLVNDKYVITAEHLFKEVTNRGWGEEIFINLTNVYLEKRATIVFSAEEIDIAILELEEGIVKGVGYKRLLNTITLQRGEKWDTEGYPRYRGKDGSQGLVGDIYKINNSEIADLELSIHNQDQGADWEGLSGAPVLIRDVVCGVVIRDKKEEQVNTTIKAISMEKIFRFLFKNNPNVLTYFKIEHDNILTQRMKAFKKLCDDVFYEYQVEIGNLKNSVLQLKSLNCLDQIYQYIELFLKDYATSAEQLSTLNEPRDIVSQREAEFAITEAVRIVKKKIMQQDKEFLIILWIIMEGRFSMPRIGKILSIINKDYMRDIYVDNDNIVFFAGYTSLQDDIDTCIDTILAEVDDELTKQRSMNLTPLIKWDKVAINYLDYSTALKIHEHRNEKKIDSYSLKIVALCSHTSNIFQQLGGEIDEEGYCYLSEILYREGLEECSISIDSIANQYSWIKEIEVQWILVPIEDKDKVKDSLTKKLG